MVCLCCTVGGAEDGVCVVLLVGLMMSEDGVFVLYC